MFVNLKMQRYARNPPAVQVSLKICNDLEDCNLCLRSCDDQKLIPKKLKIYGISHENHYRFQKMSASAFGTDFEVKNTSQKRLQRRSGRLKRPSRALQSLQKVPNGVPNGAQIHAKIDLQAK